MLTASPAEDLLASVAVDDVLLDVDPETRLRRWIEPAVAMLDRLRHQLVLLFTHDEETGYAIIVRACSAPIRPVPTPKG